MTTSIPRLSIVLLLIACAVGCGGAASEGEHGGAPGGRPAHGGGATAVPVEVASVDRRSISSYIETNGTLEAETEVDLVARVSAPIVELKAEEGMTVESGRLLARLDATEFLARLEISRVALEESRLSFERADELRRGQLISTEEFERARSSHDSARAQLRADEILVGYTEIRAPFGGRIVRRYVDFAETVTVNAPLFRISDFTPLLCPIQLPERDLRRLRTGQQAYLTVESWGDERFRASVLRISPVVDAASGTVKVTLDVDARDKLRPGMFARVFVEIDRRSRALVIPKTALSLGSIGDTVYVAADGIASRREVELGFREGDFVEIVSGVSGSDLVVVVGQDGLSDGTPIKVLRRDGTSLGEPAATGGDDAADRDARGRGPGAGDSAGHRPDFSKMTAEQLDRAREFMRARGMTDEQIEKRIRQGTNP